MDPEVEVLVVDGGSDDGTPRLAASFPHVRVFKSPRGRGVQMNTGARAARGELLVFLHADTFMGPTHLRALRVAAADPAFQAGAFRFALTPDLPAFRFLARGVNLRCRLFALPYGDQALSLRRGLFFRLGGFKHGRPEDLDLVLRLRRYTRLRLLSPPLPTSARRWLTQGYFALTLKNWAGLLRHLAERCFTSRWSGGGEIGGRG
jgi:glycosyltransferase involved in cell wall biosynthesis